MKGFEKLSKSLATFNNELVLLTDFAENFPKKKVPLKKIEQYGINVLEEYIGYIESTEENKVFISDVQDIVITFNEDILRNYLEEGQVDGNKFFSIVDNTKLLREVLSKEDGKRTVAVLKKLVIFAEEERLRNFLKLNIK